MTYRQAARSIRSSGWHPILTTVLPSAVIPVAIAYLLTVYLGTERWANLPLHSLVEGLGSFAAIILAVFITIMRRANQLRPAYIWVAGTLMGMGILDGFHAAVNPGTTFVWLHSLATFIGGLTIALVMLPGSIYRNTKTHYAPYLIAAASLALGTGSIMFPDLIPEMIPNGRFTPTAGFLNVAGGAGFIIAWVHFAWRESFEDHEEQLLLSNHCLLFGIAGVLFHFSTLWDANWWFWHVLRLSAYLVILFFFLHLYNKNAQNLRLAKQAIDNTSEAIFITDPVGNIHDVNSAYENITGYKRYELIGTDSGIAHAQHRGDDRYTNMWNQLTATGFWSGEIWDRRKDGESFPKWLTVNAIRDENDNIKNFVGIFSDITEKKSNEEKLRNLAFYDSLTSLPNRELFREHLEEATSAIQRTHGQAALMFIDLDGFKDVNDSLGHAAGDILLIEVARRFQSRIRKSDIVSRLGGDEFAILIGELKHVEQTGVLANEFLELIKAPIKIYDRELRISASIGIAIYPDDGNTVAELTKNADIAMYQAKHSGKNNYKFFLAEMNIKARNRMSLIHALHHAAEEHEFKLYYQPKIRLLDNKLIGMEALMRWPKDSNTISTYDFISCAEETGLIIEMGNWALSEACRNTKRWNKTFGTRLKLAVNLSARQFYNKNIVTDFLNILKKEEFPAELLELEITESILIKDILNAVPVINELRGHGISIAIDDFGTGYSSLSYLKHLPIDIIKIDKSFISDLTSGSDEAAIVRAIILMADTLGLTVVAEGVETDSQLEFLKQHHCHEAQGYYFGQPLPEKEYEKLIKADLASEIISE